ncbi:putative nucleic acid-binding protein [Helianthus debilis subsp. tardiflorus]
MPTIKQLIRNTRQPIRNVTKSPALRGCPQRRGTCTQGVCATRSDHELEQRKENNVRISMSNRIDRKNELHFLSKNR